MGRKDKSYSKDLKQQVYEKLTKMLHNGEGTSKKEAIRNGTDKDKIFSYNTYDTYWKHCKYFANYVKTEHPDCTTLKSAQKYVNEWLQHRVDQGLSAWTIQTEAKALGKLYGIFPDDKNYFEPPKRLRSDIKRSRGEAVRDSHFSEKNNDELVKFCKGTGLRRSGVASVKGKDLMTKEQIERAIGRLEQIPEEKRTASERKQLKVCLDTRLFDNPGQKYFIHTREKGGRDRVAPIIGPQTDRIVERFRNTKPNDKVWSYVNTNADIHGYRGDYATTLYRMYARKIEDIPFDKVNRGSGRRYQSDVYTCRKDEKGKKLDKRAMLICSKALGHNRICIVADNYLRGL